ncbi:DNA polymerase III subunit delta' [Neisseriaceae bacterium TC5R-5]|nr:DNA polymerase III subunit delta' [Neisseriaceae bacterium TC5R-5]
MSVGYGLMLYPWQLDDWRRLNKERQRLPNAWLFTGAIGIGKRQFAEHLAQSLLCEQPQADYQPCGQCQACHWYLQQSHPDFRLLSPHNDDEDEAKDSKSTRKLPIIKIEAVRAILDFAHLSAHRSGQRVVLLSPAESLNLAAANALLKMLEEPPPGLLFLLLAHTPQRLLPTIRSRCRQFPLTRPNAEQALSWLQQQGVADAKLELAHHGGTPLFEHDQALSNLRTQFIQGLAQPGLAKALHLAELVDKQKLALSVPLNWLMKWLHDLASYKLTAQIRYHPDQQATLNTLSQRTDMVQLMACQQMLNQLAPYGQHTLNTRLQLEALLMDYLKIFASPQPAAN